MASEVSQALREARARRGLELSEVERITKIRSKYLLAMEEDHWSELPGAAYARGFLATYAQVLGLDSQTLVDEYTRSAGGAEEAQPIPEEMLPQPGMVERGVPARAIWTALAAVAAVALILIAVLGGGDGEDGANGAPVAEEEQATTETTETTEEPEEEPADARIPVELRSTAPVWVCMIRDDDGRVLVDGETLPAGETRGPFNGRAFDITLGNGSIELSVAGEAIDVPDAAEPLGYRLSSRGAKDLDPVDSPDCL